MKLGSVLFAVLLSAVVALPRRPKKGNDSMTIPFDFSGNRTPIETAVIYSKEERKCLVADRVLHNGTCEELLSRGKCGEEERLVLDLRYSPGVRPLCQRRPCDRDHVYWPKDGKCLPKKDQTLCNKKGTGLYEDVFGLGMCDCNRDKVRAMHTNGVCYPLYSRGPCPRGSLFVENNEGLPDCHSDPCVKFNVELNVTHLFWEPTGTCYLMDTRGPCNEGKNLLVEIRKRKPWCSDGALNLNLVDEFDNCSLNDGECPERVKLEPKSNEFLLSLVRAANRRARL